MRGMGLGSVAIVLFFVSVHLPVAAGETPDQGACDSTGKLACAGADVGGVVDCRTTPTGHAACSWTFGWLTTGFSPVGLPGQADDRVDYDVEICSSVHGCASPSDLAGSATASCAFAAINSCEDARQGPPGTLDQALVMGECVTVSIHESAHVVATVTTGLPLASVTFDFAGVAEGATCLVDDGR